MLLDPLHLGGSGNDDYSVQSRVRKNEQECLINTHRSIYCANNCLYICVESLPCHVMASTSPTQCVIGLH